MSRVTAIISALGVICIIVCLSWAVNHYRDNAITYKAQRDSAGEPAGERGTTDMQMRQRDVMPDANTRSELADAKAENDALRDGCRRWSSSAAHQSSLSVSA